MFNNKRNSNRGQNTKEPKEYEEEVIQVDRVTKVVKGGRRLRFRVTVVIGNRKGKIGMGIGKSHEVTGAIQKAIAQAKKGIIKVAMNDVTIPHEIKVKYKSAKLWLMPAAPGTGLIAGGPLRKVLDLAGIKDILGKCLGASNKINNTKAAFEALRQLRPTPEMARKAQARVATKITPPQPQAKPQPKPKQEDIATPTNPTKS